MKHSNRPPGIRQRRELHDIRAQVVSPPPTYDDSTNDTAVSVIAISDTAAGSVLEDPERQTSPPPAFASRPASIFTRAQSLMSQISPPAVSIRSRPLPASSQDRSRAAMSSQTTSVSPNPPQAPRIRPAREEVVLSPPPESEYSERSPSMRRYYFSPVGPYSMVLVASLTAPDTRPLYHISWRQDYFTPLSNNASVVTTIRRGATEEGTFVAEFGLGALRVRGEEETFVVDKLKPDPWNDSRWTWCYNGVKHMWSSDKRGALPYYLCRRETPTNDVELLAIMRPADYNALGSARNSQLKIYPGGQDYLEEILLCALIITRQKLGGCST